MSESQRQFALTPEDQVNAPAALSNPLTGLEKLGRDVASALKPLRALRTLERDQITNAGKMRPLIKSARSTLGRLPEGAAIEASSWLDQLESDLDELQARSQENFAAELAKELNALGLTLGGNLPLLKVSLFSIEVRPEDARVWFGPQRELLATMPKLAPRAAQLISDLLTKLRGHKFDQQSFLQVLYQAYQAALALQDGAPNTPVRLEAVHRQVILLRQEKDFSQRQRLHEYSRAQFGFDLYRLKERRYRTKSLHLVTATKSESVSKLDSLWVPSDESGRGSLFSKLVFREGS